MCHLKKGAVKYHAEAALTDKCTESVPNTKLNKHKGTSACEILYQMLPESCTVNHLLNEAHRGRYRFPSLAGAAAPLRVEPGLHASFVSSEQLS